MAIPTANTSTFQARLEQHGNIAELLFEAFMMQYCHKRITRIGQEAWLPGWVHGKLRFNYNQDAELIKHFPDYDCGKSLVQVKDAPSESEYPSVTIERASYNVAVRFINLGIPVYVVWLFQDRKSFYGQRADLIKPIQSKGDNGSGTPMSIVYKSQLRPLLDFYRDL